MISEEQISRFLEGRNQKKYIVAVEVPYDSNTASLIINDPIKGKYISKDTFSSFLWFKEPITRKMFAGNRTTIKKMAEKYRVTITKLKTSTNGEASPDRLNNGYKFMAKCDGSYGQLLNFFKKAGIDVYGDDKHNFVAISPVEQYMIASGKRLFKGMEDYDDVHRLQFDLETTGLKSKGDLLSSEEIRDIKSRMDGTEDLTKLYEFDANHNPLRHKDHEIFQVGVKDNRGFEEIFEVPDGTKEDRRDGERLVIFKMFDTINRLKPDIISGYNSEFFDWPFIFSRCEILGLNIELLAKTLDPTYKYKINRVDKTLKLGGDSEYYKQTVMWGFNIVDTSHAVRRAKAINSNIKKWGLKYITKFSKLNKKNRVYVKGDKIYSTWNDKTTKYGFNEVDGTYYKLTTENPIKEGFNEVLGDKIVRRYLLDDLWETEQVDGLFNQAAFLISKILPTTYMRSTTMGTGTIWKLIMLAWSYENRLAIPELMPKETFTGGLSRLLEVGFAKNVCKLDYAALYPNIELTWDIFPFVDISHVMKGMLLYIADTRDKYKNLMNESKEKKREATHFLEDNSETLSVEEKEVFTNEIARLSTLISIYDKKQLPIKILGNSFFGSLGSPYLFNWGDIDCAEETTCRGRQYLRLMVKYFKIKGFKPLVGDTDGFNFAIPTNVDTNKYTPKGIHRFTLPNKDKELVGLDAVVAEFNELYMIGRMGLDIDDVCESTINFARKNYANSIDGKVKLVGNTIKSSKMPIYIEEFLDEGIDYLLKGDGHSFIQAYNETVQKIYNFQIPLVKIASKANVKTNIKAYLADMKTTTKSGASKARKAYMELIIANNLTPNLGETIYYVNTGTNKGQGDVQKVPTVKYTAKETREYFAANGKNPDLKHKVQINCKLIPADQIENNPDLTTDEYNVPKYLEAFNKRITPLLVCFRPEIRDMILTNMVKNKKTEEMDLTEIYAFTKKDCELTSGIPFSEGDQDTFEELMTMEDKEIEFWIRVNKEPNNLEDLDFDWPTIQVDYHERKRIERIEGIKYEKELVRSMIKRLEVNEIKLIKEKQLIPDKMNLLGQLVVHDDKDYNPNIYLKSHKWEVDLASIQDIFKYEAWANQRDIFYSLCDTPKQRTYEFWLVDIWERATEAEDSVKADKIKKEIELIGDFTALLKKKKTAFKHLVIK